MDRVINVFFSPLFWIDTTAVWCNLEVNNRTPCVTNRVGHEKQRAWNAANWRLLWGPATECPCLDDDKWRGAVMVSRIHSVGRARTSRPSRNKVYVFTHIIPEFSFAGVNQRTPKLKCIPTWSLVSAGVHAASLALLKPTCQWAHTCTI